MSAPIVRTVRVDAEPHAAFSAWVERIDAWWPKSHTRSKDPHTRIVLEPRPGGRFYECTADGSESDFGSVVTIDPPHRLAYHWYLGSDRVQPTLVEVRFVAVTGGTEVTVEHGAGDDRIERWNRNKGGYERAWDDLLPSFRRSLE